MGDWQVGDLALCMRGGPVVCQECGGRHEGKYAPKKGAVEQVIRLSRCGSPENCYDEVGDNCPAPVLYLAGGFSGLHTRFIKITPPEADAFDREVIEQMTGAPAEVHP